MAISIFLTLFFIAFYFGYGAYYSTAKKELQEISLAILMVSMIIVWCSFFITQEKYEFNAFLDTFLICLSVYITYTIYNISKAKSMKIVAKQESYWGIDQDDIIKFYANKLDERQDRVEVKTNIYEKQIYRQYANDVKMITANIFIEMQNLQLLKVKNVNEIQSNLYTKIYNKILDLNVENEIKNDMNEILKENDYIVEYFLIDIWCKFTIKDNIGIATLSILAENDTEFALLGALDNATMQSVKRHGAGLYFMYMKFKGLLP